MGIAEDVLRDYRVRQPQQALPDLAALRTGVEAIHLEAAVALGLYGSVRRATEALNLKRATFNRRIRDLEFRLGTPLFERSRRGASPTRLGAIFLRHAARALNEFSTLVDSIRRLADGRAGDITIGYTGTATGSAFRDILSSFSGAIAGFNPIPIELSHERLLEMLEVGGVDLAVIRGSVQRFSGTAVPMWSERLVVGLPPNHRLVLRPSLCWSDLAGETVLVSRQDPVNGLAAYIQTRLREIAGRAEIVQHAVSPFEIVQMVAGGQGICLCLASLGNCCFGDVVFRELEPRAGSDEITAYLCWKAQSANPALLPFLRQVARRLPKLRPALADIEQAPQEIGDASPAPAVRDFLKALELEGAA